MISLLYGFFMRVQTYLRPLVAAVMAAGTLITSVAAAEPPSYKVADGWDVSMALAAHYRPEYEGSEDNDLRALPQFLAVYQDKFFAGLDAGVGFYAWYRPQTKGWAAIGYNIGRDENDSDHLDGLGDIDGGATLILGTAYLSPVGEFTLRLHHQFTGEADNSDDVGGYLFAGFQTKLDLNEQWFISPALDVYIASDDYMQSYFGVSSRQSAASGLREYDADGGLQSVGVRLRLVYQLDQHWRLQSAVVYHRMQGDSEDSPITQDPNQYQLAIGAQYHF